MQVVRNALAVLIAITGITTAEERTPVATIMLNDGSVFEAEVVSIADGVVHWSLEGKPKRVPLVQVSSLRIRPRKADHSQPAPSPRVGVARIELKSIHDLAKRLDRIGADWEFVPPEADLETLTKYDVICFAAGWGKLSGLAALAPTYHAYVKLGGGLFMSGPGVIGGADLHPAMLLLPYPLEAARHRSEMSVVQYHPGKPHPLTQGIEANDLPFPYSMLRIKDENWQVLARSAGEATLAAATFGTGRTVIHTGRDNYGHRHYWTDPMVVRVIKWLSNASDEAVRAGSKQLGPRRWPEYVRRLDRDFERLLAAEPPAVRASLLRARQILAYDAQQPSTWTSYSKALELVNKRRSKAAIPLLLQLLADDRLEHGNYQGSVFESFELLTGKPVVGSTPEEVARLWWFPMSEQITVSPAQMKEAQFQVVVEKLLDIVSRKEPHGLGRTPPLSTSTVHAVLRGGFRVYASEHRELLDKRLLPALLAAAETPEQRWLVVGPLAAMYHLRRANELDSLISDRRKPATQRVVAAAAVFRATQTVPAVPLSAMYRDTKQLDLRQTILWLLGQSDDPAAVETVLGALAEEQAELREMAVFVIPNIRSPRAIKPLGELILDQWRDDKSASTYIRGLVRIGGQQSAAEVADLMKYLLHKDPDSKILSELLHGFISITHRAFPADDELASVSAALQWWSKQ